MEIKDDTYKLYATTRITDVPLENVKYLVNLFLQDAAKDMGSELKGETLDRVIFCRFVLWLPRSRKDPSEIMAPED